MSQAKALATGFVIAVVIGGGGGFALGPLAASGASASTQAPPQPQMATARVVIEHVEGVAKVLGRGDVWRRVRAGDSVERPTVLVTEGIGSSVIASQGNVRVVAKHDARVVLSAPGSAMSIQLDEGLVLVHSRGNQMRVYVPASQLVLGGEAFGVWARKDRLVAAVLEGEVALETPSISTKYAKGREIGIDSRGPVPLVLASQLEIAVDKTEKAGNKYRLTGKTTPNALLLVRRGNRYDTVDVSANNGSFAVELEGREPGRGDLVAYDAAGRRAEVNVPSETLDDVVAALAKGEPSTEKPGTASEREPPIRVAAEPAPEAQKAQPPPTVEAVPPPREEEPKPVAAKKEPAKKVEKTEPAPRGSEPDPIKIEMPPLPSEGEKAAPAKQEPPAKKAAKKKGAAPKAAEGEDEPEKKEAEDKPVELEWE